MKKLLAYQIGGQSVGVDITTWYNSQLNGNRTFKVIVSGDTIPNSYADISSIINWGRFGENEESYANVRLEIQNILPESLTGLTESELSIVSEYKLDSYYRIYDYIEFDDSVDPQIAPLNLDYDILGLHKKRYFDKGELYKVEYYGEHIPQTNTYSKLCVIENRIYYRTNRMLNRREMDITWYYNDGTSGETKHTIKYYTLEAAISAGEVRRRNVVSNLKMNTVGLLMMTSGITQTEAEILGFEFLNVHNNKISKYIEGVESILKNAILTDSEFTWLDNVIPNTGGITIRLYLNDNVNIDYTINNTDL